MVVLETKNKVDKVLQVHKVLVNLVVSYMEVLMLVLIITKVLVDQDIMVVVVQDILLNQLQVIEVVVEVHHITDTHK